jgi:hypothetical protein
MEASGAPSRYPEHLQQLVAAESCLAPNTQGEESNESHGGDATLRLSLARLIWIKFPA